MLVKHDRVSMHHVDLAVNGEVKKRIQAMKNCWIDLRLLCLLFFIHAKKKINIVTSPKKIRLAIFLFVKINKKKSLEKCIP